MGLVHLICRCGFLYMVEQLCFPCESLITRGENHLAFLRAVWSFAALLVHAAAFSPRVASLQFDTSRRNSYSNCQGMCLFQPNSMILNTRTAGRETSRSPGR